MRPFRWKRPHPDRPISFFNIHFTVVFKCEISPNKLVAAPARQNGAADPHGFANTSKVSCVIIFEVVQQKFLADFFLE